MLQRPAFINYPGIWVGIDVIPKGYLPVPGFVQLNRRGVAKRVLPRLSPRKVNFTPVEAPFFQYDPVMMSSSYPIIIFSSSRTIIGKEYVGRGTSLYNNVS